MKFEKRIHLTHVKKRVFDAYMDTKTLIMVDFYKVEGSMSVILKRILDLDKPKISTIDLVYAHEIAGYAETCKDVFEILLKVSRTVYK